jgi:DNA-binding response OmpR family regulator
MHILIIEDNRDLAANIGEYLESRDHAVDIATDGVAGLRLAGSNRYDAVILDLGLPGLDGLTLCKRLREEAHRTVPVLILTARDTLRDKLAGFEAGADDYLIKPFALAELHARVQALVRRSAGGSEILQVADLSFDTRALVVRRAGKRLSLTASELRLLERLMRASPGVLSRHDAARALWDNDPPESDAALRGHIHTLRQTIDRDFSPRLLHTVHGVGYRLAPDDAQ